MGMAARQQYDRKEMHAAITTLDEKLKPAGITKVEAALRWIAYHSKLVGPGDGIILGASKIAQVDQNVEAIAKGPLPDEVVQAIEGVWETVNVVPQK